MPGAERESRLDLDGEVVRTYRVAVMRAMDEKPPGADRIQPLQGSSNPILLVDRLEDGGVRLFAHEGANQVADHLLVRCIGEIGL